MTILYSAPLFSNLDLRLISFLSAHPIFWHDLYHCTQSRASSLTIVYMLLLLSSPLFLPSHPTTTPTPTSTSSFNSHSDLWLLILSLSTRRTGAREMTCFRLGWKETHTRTHTQAMETASSSQCNYGETEQSVTHLSAARIRAGVLLCHWWRKPGVSLLKHDDRQLHLLTWPRWQNKYLEWKEKEKVYMEHEGDTVVSFMDVKVQKVYTGIEETTHAWKKSGAYFNVS